MLWKGILNLWNFEALHEDIGNTFQYCHFRACRCLLEKEKVRKIKFVGNSESFAPHPQPLELKAATVQRTPQVNVQF